MGGIWNNSPNIPYNNPQIGTRWNADIYIYLSIYILFGIKINSKISNLIITYSSYLATIIIILQQFNGNPPRTNISINK